MVPKRELTFVLPYLGRISLNLSTRLRKTNLPNKAIYLIVNWKWFLDRSVDLIPSFDLKIHLRQKFALE